MKITTIVISNNDWNTQSFSAVAEQIKVSARKILKGIDVGIERKRFNNACNILENLAIKNGSEIKIQEKRLQEIINSISNSTSLLPFIESDKLSILPKIVDEETRKIVDSKSTLVFFVSEYSNGSVSVILNPERDQINHTTESNIKEFNSIVTDKIEQKRFDEQILFALQTGNPVGWINVESVNGNTIKGTTPEERKAEIAAQKLLRHEGIITCLREHIFAKFQPNQTEKYKVREYVLDVEANEKRSRSFLFRVINYFSKQPEIKKQIEVSKTKVVNLDIIPRSIQFAFEDGSISEQFPLYSMIDIKPNAKLHTIKVALISNRHFELDKTIETCILRNSEISRLEEATISEQEKLSFSIARNFFIETIEKTGGVHVELFHTGLEPAVIGTYRALISLLWDKKKNYRGKIIVTPKVFKGGNKFDDLKQWY